MATKQDTPQDDIRQRLFGLLLDKVERDQYPSLTMLDMIESILTPAEVSEYAEVLMAKIEGEQYPSYDLIQRVTALG